MGCLPGCSIVLIALVLSIVVGRDLLDRRRDPMPEHVQHQRPGFVIVALLLLIADMVLGGLVAWEDLTTKSYPGLLGLVSWSALVALAALAMAVHSLAAPKAVRSNGAQASLTLGLIMVFGIGACYGLMIG